MVCLEVEPIIAAGIPMVDKLDQNRLKLIKRGDLVSVDATQGLVEVRTRKEA